MAGLSDTLMLAGEPYILDGMVNYKIVSDRLGLVYEPDWLEGFGHEMENRIESIITHDTPPNAEPDSDYWAYINSGFTRIAELLDEKYYTSSNDQIRSYDEFKHLFLIDLAGLVEGRIDENGESFQDGQPPDYDLKTTLEFLGLEHEAEWLEQLRGELVQDGVLEPSRALEQNKFLKYSLTRKGYELAQELSENYGREGYMLALTGESDLYFSVDASHISRLGLELVAKQETAVAELVKNGYDADATNVDLIVNTASEPTSLEVFDNGSGMTLEELENGFMRLSTQSKVTSPLSKLYSRQKAGRKGIGRFAAQRLGRQLILETATADSEFGIRLKINWDDFEAKQTLSSVSSKITRIKKPFAHGTKLVIQNLRDGWSDAQIKRSYRHVSELIQPFPLADVVSERNFDPGFQASFLRESDDDFTVVADDWTSYFNHALAEIEGNVDENGIATWSLKSQKFGIKKSDEPISNDKEDLTKPYDALRNVKFKAYYYIDKEVQRSVRGDVGRKLQSDGGIRLYRNGFRVLPYGERYDDWLKLNASNLMRSILPPHSNRNFLGFVEIIDIDGENFEETSSREGLVENASFVELKDFISSTLKTAVLPIATARNKESTTTKTRQRRRTPKGQADEILEKLASLQDNAKEDPEYAAALSSVITVIRESVIDLGVSGESLLKELEMMRVLASLGITIGEFTHEIGISMEAIRASINLIVGGDKSVIAEQSTKINEQLSSFEGYLNYFDNTVRENVNRDISVVEIRDVVKSFLKVLQPKTERQDLVVFDKYKGFSLFVKPMHKSEWSSILINLFTNSLKAIRRAGTNGKIGIVCGRSKGNVYLEFMDNGDGIDANIQDRVFDPFFTTTAIAGVSGDDDSLAGMGLGLKIVKDIVKSNGGNVFLKEPVEGYSTCFRVEIPEASEDEMSDNDY